VAVAPETIRAHLNADQYALYELIWKRTVACQMIPATLDTVAADLACGAGNSFRATGSVVADPGFMAVYQEGVDDQADDIEGRMLPPLRTGEWVDLLALRPEQHFTEPPPRFSEASLVKTLEEYGIGRPSTYAAIISTLLAREYAVLDNRRFKPTDIGRIVNRFLTQHFTQYVDYDFTARLEDNLDAVSRGEEDWLPLMRGFWDPFKQRVEEKDGKRLAPGRGAKPRVGQRPQDRQTGFGADGPIRPLRTDRRQGGCRQTALRQPAVGAADEYPHPG
jgi:DNA topoisomerase-1